MIISEIYESIQGEGRYTGLRSVFVRTTGCNLRCRWCDTPYTSSTPVGARMECREVLNKVLEFSALHVVLTGGEPMLQRDIVPLSQQLIAHGRFVTIETAGTVDRPVAAHLMSISPKLGNSVPYATGHWKERHISQQLVPPTIRRLVADYDFQIKFVVDQPEDLSEIKTWLKRFPQISKNKVWLMPQGVDPDELRLKNSWIEEIASQHGYHACPRKHIEMFGNVRGT